MSRNTFSDTLTEMFALLADTSGRPVSSLATLRVSKVFDYEPGASGWVKPCSVTLFPSAIEPTDWTITARVYVDGAIPPKDAQQFLIDVPVAVGDLLADGQGYGPDRWEMGWSPDLDCYLATSTVLVGRQDF